MVWCWGTHITFCMCLQNASQKCQCATVSRFDFEQCSPLWHRTSLPWIQTLNVARGQLKCDGTRAEKRFRLSAKRMAQFQSAGASVQSTTGSRGVRISVSNAGNTMFWGSVKSTGYPLHSPVSPSLPLPCVTVCHHITTRVCLQGLKTSQATSPKYEHLYSVKTLKFQLLIWLKCKDDMIKM